MCKEQRCNRYSNKPLTYRRANDYFPDDLQVSFIDIKNDNKLF